MKKRKITNDYIFELLLCAEVVIVLYEHIVSHLDCLSKRNLVCGLISVFQYQMP